jgi:hypothetical protein
MEFSSHDGRQDREARLQKALRLACAITGLTGEQAGLLITSMRDERGVLNVAWVSPPSDQQVNAFRVAWEQCGEPGRVLHLCNGVARKG